jgi:PAS domain S-box-containing protein
MTWDTDDAMAARVPGMTQGDSADGSGPLLAALAQMGEGVIVADAGGRITFVNAAAARLHGAAPASADPAAAVLACQLLTEDGQRGTPEQLPLAQAARHREPVHDARWRVRRPDGTELRVVGSARPLLGAGGACVGAVLTLREDAAPSAALAASARRAEQLAALSAALAVASTVDEVAVAVVTHAAAVLQAAGIVIARLCAEGTHLEIMRVGAMPDDVHEEWRRFPLAAPVPLSEVARTGRPLFLESRDDWAARYPAMAPLLEVTGHHANAIAPLVVEGRVLGVVGAAYEAPRRFDDAARALALTVAQQAGQALERARLFEAERAARAESEAQSARFRAVQDASVDGFAIARAVRDAEGSVVDFEYAYANPAADALTAGAVPTLAGRRMLEVFPHLEEAGTFAAYAAVADGGPPFLTEMEYRADGLDAAYRISAVRIGSDEVGISFSDVSERTRLREAERQALAQARAARDHLERVISQAPVSMYIARGREHVYEVVNDAWCAIVRRRPDEVIGRTVREVFPEVGAQGIYDLVERVYDSGEAHVDAAQRIVLADGAGRTREHFFNIVYQPLRDAGGAVYAMAVVATEVTELVQARRDAETALGVAEAANRAKGEFLAVMSHELRTPLNAIGGYAELIELGIHGPVTPEQRNALGRIQTAQLHLLGLINEVLNYTRVEAGVVRYEVGEVSVAATLVTCETLTAPQVRARGLTLDVAACEPTTLSVRADREKVQQILLNLLSNAVKFTEPGGRIAMWCTATASRVAIHVADTGRGIASEQQERVFEPFVQVDASRTRTQDGVGLGLAISRDLARGMRGDLTVASAPGRGSTFTLELPRGGG